MSEQTNKADEGLIKDRYELLFRELQNVLSFGYLLLVVIGMLFESIYYSYHEINIFEYSTILDFLLAPFRRPITILLLGIALLSIFLGYSLDVFLEKRLPRLHNILNLGWARRPGFRRFRMVGLVVLLFGLTVFYAFMIGKKSREFIVENNRPNIRIELHSDPDPIEGYKVGMNGSYLFLADSSGKLQAFPVDSNVKSIQPISAD